jgi:hypothetical protein
MEDAGRDQGEPLVGSLRADHKLTLSRFIAFIELILRERSSERFVYLLLI